MLKPFENIPPSHIYGIDAMIPQDNVSVLRNASVNIVKCCWYEQYMLQVAIPVLDFFQS